jgi:hypothetical protein
VTSAEPSSADAALAEALTTEHGVIYGYGMVSAHSPPEINYLVAEAIHRHRDRRDRVVAMLTARSVTAPVAAAGYQLPIPVHTMTDAARLAVRMEDDAAMAWRAVLEHGETVEDRTFAVTALTQAAVLAARWNRVLGAWPITDAFPGGSPS